METSKACNFLLVNPGDYVIIRNQKKWPVKVTAENEDNYWIGHVINCIGGARNPSSWTLFQVVNIDNGKIIIINADIVERIVEASNN